MIGYQRHGITEVQRVSFVCYTGGEGGRIRLWNLQSLHAVPPYALSFAKSLRGGRDRTCPKSCILLSVPVSSGRIASSLQMRHFQAFAFPQKTLRIKVHQQEVCVYQSSPCLFSRRETVLAPILRLEFDRLLSSVKIRAIQATSIFPDPVLVVN